MKMHNEKMSVSVVTLAVQAALIAMFAVPLVAVAEGAANPEADALKRPISSVEIGVLNVVHDSAKFGEYNGLDDSGAYAVGNVDVSGGSAYEEGDGTMRWKIKGADLGTTSRALGGSIESQGQWGVGINFDELRHNLSDGYRTPFIGSMGGNNFTLPSNFDAVTVTTSALPGSRSLTSTQLGDFHNEKIYTTRENSGINASYTINPQWNVNFDFNHLNQTGAKLRAFPAAGTLNGGGAGSSEVIAILPNPTNYSTDSVNFAVNWAGDKAHLTTSYFGSFFRDGYDRVRYEGFAGAAKSMQTISTAPDNEFHQLNLLGGYTLTDKTKLAGGFSYGRATQNDPFVVDSFQMVTPASRASLNGKVINTHADLKLTNQSINKLTLTAGFKYDERDNQSPSNIYNFYATDGGNPANYPNTPLSNRKTQYELAGDYRLDNKQHFRLAYNRENIQRWCNQYAVGGGNYSAINSPYLAGTQCVVAGSTKDDKVSLTYKLNATEDVHLNVGYSYSDRSSDFNPLARSAFIEYRNFNGISIAGQTGALTAPGLNGGDFLGFHPFFTADRVQQVLKTGIDWQATDKLSINASGKYTDDNYDTAYGFQKGNTWSLNLDATLQYAEHGSVNAYLTKEHRARDMTNLQAIAIPILATGTKIGVPAGGTWSNKLEDDDITFGLGAKQGGLMGGKLEIAGDLTYSLGETAYGTALNYNGLDTASRDCSNAFYLSCGQLPDVRNSMVQFKLRGDYKVSKSGAVVLGYLYQHLNSTDYFYNAYQYGFTPQKVLPSYEASGSYSVNVITAAYTYSF